MNTNSLKRFATVARSLLMHGVRNRLKALGFNDDGSVRVEPEAKGNSAVFDGRVINDSRFVARWNALRDRIASHGVKEVIEEAAYTWFNRLIAIRILEYNSLAPALLDYENPEIRIPRIVTDARAGKTPVLSDEDRASLDAVIGDGRLSFEQFSLLIRAYCENNPIIRKCFGGITDYTALLLPADILAEGNFIDLLNEADRFIDPADYRKPELIGWLYQFYISEKKDEVFAKKGGYDSDEIPAATQIFTPNWIVKYMVENTLGRIYLDNNPGSPLAKNWKYLVEQAEPTPADAVLRYGQLENLTCGDLSCGSGHILNEMFDLLMQLYEDDFYSPREAIEAIFIKNMVGIDLDIRARQLSQFALLLKACQRDSAFADGHCMPRIFSFPDVHCDTLTDLWGHFNCAYQLELPNDETYNQLTDAFELMLDADALGSIMKFDLCDAGREYLSRAVAAYDAEPKHTDSFSPLVDAFRVILALTDKYAAICMNPPYMVPNKNPILGKYAKENYPDSCSDMATVFIEVMARLSAHNGQFAYIIPPSWMFLSGFERLRRKIIDNLSIQSLLHLSRGVFGADFGASSAVIKKCLHNDYKGTYFRLIERTFQEFDQKHLKELFEKVLANHEFKFLFKNYSKDIESIEYSEDGARIFYSGINQKQFEQIPGAPIAYWLNSRSFDIFLTNSSIGDVANPCKGIDTGDNDYFLRFWHEISILKLDTTHGVGSWVPYNKGGGFRKWYGNRDNVLRWNGSDSELKARLRWPSKKPTLRGKKHWFKECGTWSSISSGDFSLRYSPIGAMADNGGSCIYASSNLLAIIGFLNSKVAKYYFEFLAPTINFQPGDVGNQPYIPSPKEENLDTIVEDAIAISKQDWDAHETSWDFQTNELVKLDAEEAENIIHDRNVELSPEVAEEYRHTEKLRIRMELYMEKWWQKFQQLHANEEELNKRFIEIYGLQNELTPDVMFDEVTILQQGEIRIQKDCNPDLVGQLHRAYRDEVSFNWDVIIKQYISYAVGCMMGRYRLDRPGLAIVYPNPTNEEIAPYIVPQSGEEWWIDDDGIVPMMGEDSPFHDNAANRFTEFVRVTLGNENLTENMNFVRDAIGKDVVDYFRLDFYTDHKKMYQNRPIYWMFSSNQKGKRAAFQCLVYMHRMNRFTPEHIRTNYLLPYIDHLAAREAELSARSSLSAKENKLLKQLRSDLDECRDYQLRLHEFADRQIEIDLDEGVVKNYATFAPVLAKLK